MLEKENNDMPNKRKALGATLRGSCLVCHQGFAAATDAQFRQRYTSHLGSVRHQRYLELQTAPPDSGKVILKSQECINAIFERARNNPHWPGPTLA
jgi:hypothetical protein